MYIVTISWFLQTSTGFHNTVQNGSYKNIYGNCYKTVSWKLFEDYGDNLIYMIFVGFIVVGFFFFGKTVYSLQKIYYRRGFNHTRENSIKLYLQTVLVHLVTVSQHV